jgi:2-oxo-4-hydroxy-4-carboxy--5-ureidoimidazoline (OHCU) decarboxylase
MSSLPPISDVLASSATRDTPLAQALSLLFEPSPILFSTLVPQLVPLLRPDLHTTILSSYREVIHTALDIVSSWDDDRKAEFIAGHPRIGETKASMSKLSIVEQGGTTLRTTAPEVLARLAYLNALYERQYPGLRYITFVNGRNREAIAEEMEALLGIEKSQLGNGSSTTYVEPEKVERVGGDVWKAELDRAISDVG